MWQKCRLYMTNGTNTNTFDLTPENNIVEFEGAFDLKSLTSRLWALDRTDSNGSFFTVEPIPLDYFKPSPDHVLEVSFVAWGPAICFSLAPTDYYHNKM